MPGQRFIAMTCYRAKHSRYCWCLALRTPSRHMKWWPTAQVHKLPPSKFHLSDAQRGAIFILAMKYRCELFIHSIEVIWLQSFSALFIIGFGSGDRSRAIHGSSPLLVTRLVTVKLVQGGEEPAGRRRCVHMPPTTTTDIDRHRTIWMKFLVTRQCMSTCVRRRAGQNTTSLKIWIAFHCSYH